MCSLASRRILRILTPLFVQRRNRNPNELAVVGRIHSEIVGADRLLDGRDLRGVPGLNGDHTRFGHVQVRDLVDRGRRAIVIDPHVIEKIHVDVSVRIDAIGGRR